MKKNLKFESICKVKYIITRISGPDGPLILAVDLRNTPKGGGYGRTHGPTHCFIYIDEISRSHTKKYQEIKQIILI